MKSPENKDSHILESLNKVHYSQAGNFSGRTISPELIRVLWLIAAFILLIACVNFINLATAQAVNRSKEVGVRKVMGSNKWQLKLQFLAETFLIVITAVALALVLSVVLLPAISKLLAIPLAFNIFQNTSVLIFLFIVTVCVTLLAGFYPSVVLSGFNPIHALKSQLAVKNTKGISLRRGLVVFQFIIAQALIIGTIIIVKQMNYFTSKPLGFDKDAIINVPFPGDSAGISKLDYLRKELSGISGIQNISFSSNTPIEDDNDNWTKFKYNHAAKETDFYAINKGTDNEYLPTYKLPLVAGRNLQASDTVREFLVNESLVNKLGITNPQEVLNKEISLWDGQLRGNIVGVLKDFHNRSFRAPFAPLLMTTAKNWYSVAAVKLTTQDAATTIRSVEKIWNNEFPDFVFEYKFLDEKIENFYKQENQLSQLYKVFAVIAIFLSCLGLYGLVSFMAVQRIKEVGIRKVLGASAGSIVYLFSKEFMLLIGIAFLIASPLAWYFMHKWLQDYPYRINLSWWIFILGGAASVIIALITVSFRAVKAAVANPVTSLRTE
jgi:ABC-type antimicrobial peptide transport system permease subunit